MARPDNRGKERFWKRVVRRWRRSGLSVRAFCVTESISQASFYAWRRELERRDQETAAAKPRFLPVQIRDDVDGTPAGDDVEPAAPPAIDIVLVNGRRLRVVAGFNPAMLRQLLAVAEESTPC